jgi:hypothetical protein
MEVVVASARYYYYNYYYYHHHHRVFHADLHRGKNDTAETRITEEFQFLLPSMAPWSYCE